MREFTISIGGHLTSCGLRLGDHLTSGPIGLYSLLYHLYTSGLCAVVADVDGECLLRTFAGITHAAVPELSAGVCRLSAAAGGEGGIVPLAEGTEGAGLVKSAGADAGIVPDAGASGTLMCSASGEGGVLVFCAPAGADVVRILGDVLAQVEVCAEDARARLAKSASAGASVCPSGQAAVSAGKASEAACGVVPSCSASGSVVRWRKLYEVDGKQLSEMGGMTLGELDVVSAGA